MVDKGKGKKHSKQDEQKEKWTLKVVKGKEIVTHFWLSNIFY